MRRSIEDVLLVEHNIVGAKSTRKLRLEILGLVMRTLPLDVTFQRFLLRLAHRKCAVALLSCECGEFWKCRVDPFARTGFHRAHQIRYSGVGPPSQIHVHMVFDPADFIQNTIFRSHDAADIGIEALSDSRRNPGCTTLRRGHDVEEKLRVGAWH